jgi:NhaP-type Na+/H+ or K+/H+ antiporter
MSSATRAAGRTCTATRRGRRTLERVGAPAGGKIGRVITADGVLLLVGLSVVLLGLFSKVVKRHALSPVLLATGAGVLVGPRALDLLDPLSQVPRHVLLEQLARVALAMSVVDIALRLRPSDLRANRLRLAVLLAVVMPGMWLVTAWGASLLLGLPLAVALLLGACLTPTDPGVASALVTGTTPDRSLPRRVRMSLQGEAAANDGLALPFVLFSGLLATLPLGTAASEFAVEAGRQIGVAVLVGAASGWSLMRLVDWAGVERLAEEDWFPLAASALAVSVLALAHLLGGTGVLAAFVAGLFFAEGLPEGLRQPIHEVHRSLTKVALTVVFLVFGTVLPVDRWWPELGLAGALFALWVLFLRRLPIAFPAVRATRTGPMSAGYIGWSGPLGVAGIYYLALAHRYQLPEYERLFLAGSLAITASVLGQALAAAFLVQGYRRRTGVEDPGEQLELRGPLP